jgi:hypothetical protein
MSERNAGGGDSPLDISGSSHGNRGDNLLGLRD